MYFSNTENITVFNLIYALEHYTFSFPNNRILSSMNKDRIATLKESHFHNTSGRVLLLSCGLCCSSVVDAAVVDAAIVLDAAVVCWMLQLCVGCCCCCPSFCVTVTIRLPYGRHTGSHTATCPSGLALVGNCAGVRTTQSITDTEHRN